MWWLKIAGLLFSAFAVVTGLLSAWYWYRSSTHRFRITTAPMITGTASGPASVIMSNDLETYLSEIGGLNASAALFGAMSILASTVASLIG